MIWFGITGGFRSSACLAFIIDCTAAGVKYIYSRISQPNRLEIIQSSISLLNQVSAGAGPSCSCAENVAITFCVRNSVGPPPHPRPYINRIPYRSGVSLTIRVFVQLVLRKCRSKIPPDGRCWCCCWQLLRGRAWWVPLRCAKTTFPTSMASCRICSKRCWLDWLTRSTTTTTIEYNGIWTRNS